MEEKKYYTPNIEELHVGFELERYKFVTNKAGELVPMTLTIEDFSTLTVDDGLICQKGDVLYVRAKYLDKEDIESLGWRHDQYHVYSKEIDKQSYILLFHQLDKLEIRPNGNNPFLPTFYGCIKNKSELKVLMKQLGIQ